MLTSNLNVSDGLVNGATGTVEDIELQNGQVQHVIVHFDREDVGQQASKAAGRHQQVPIGRHEAKFTVGRHYGAEMTRSQFPLTLAWGCTIHKVQGITVDHGRCTTEVGPRCLRLITRGVWRPRLMLK